MDNYEFKSTCTLPLWTKLIGEIRIDWATTSYVLDNQISRDNSELVIRYN